MKFVAIILFSLLTVGSFQADHKYHMKFDTRLIDLGEIKKGEKKSAEFNYENTGSEDIIIELVSACECTTVDHTYDPIKPGEKGVIAFTFDSTIKEESETIDIDIYLENKDPKTGEGIRETVQYKYTLIK